MQNKKFLFDRIGTVSRINGSDKAEIEFEMNNCVEKALLRKDKFFYNGRHIPENKPLNDYMSVGTEVKFSCHILNNQDEEQKPIWYVMICQNYEKIPEKRLTLKTGLVNITGCVREVHRRHGVLFTDYPNERDSMIYFLASKFYLDGKRLPSSRALSEVLNVNDIVFFDAIPCIPEENELYSKWFAVLVFKGKRPESHRFADNKLLENNQLDEAVSYDKKLKKNPQSLKLKIYEGISRYTNDARTLFAFGKGLIMNIPNEEFGIILGQFKPNQFQSVLFHRKNAFLFKLCLANSDLTQIFVEGDRVNFIAVGAPSGFSTDWIAIQVSVQTNDKVYQSYDIASTTNQLLTYD